MVDLAYEVAGGSRAGRIFFFLSLKRGPFPRYSVRPLSPPIQFLFAGEAAGAFGNEGAGGF